MQRLRLILLAFTALAPFAAVDTALAQGTIGPCRPGQAGPECTVTLAQVAWVDDGDTLHVRPRGSSKQAPASAVRITGVNAPELTTYHSDPARRRGECGSLEATARLEQLVKRSKGIVRLAARDEDSRSFRRMRRHVAVRIEGRWQDVGRVLVSEGRGLWLSQWEEDAWNLSYSVRQQQAAAAGLGMFQRDRCGPGPQPEAQVRVWVNWDADGPDDQNLEGEWVRVKNTGPAPLDLGGWWVRDSSLRKYTFGPGTTIQPGEAITVRVGSGVDSGPFERHWRLVKPLFDNARAPEDGATGDGAFLVDPLGNLRAWMLYPCHVSCAHPLRGLLQLSVRPSGRREHVRLRNPSDTTVDLEGTRLAAGPFGYAFPAGTTIPPGGTLQIDSIGDPEDDTAEVKYWGVDREHLVDRGGSVRLETFDRIVLGCTAWGSATC